MFQWIEKLKEIAAEQNSNTQCDDRKVEEVIIETTVVRNCSKYDVFHGSAIQDRKSTFQAHVCSVQSQHDVK